MLHVAADASARLHGDAQRGPDGSRTETWREWPGPTIMTSTNAMTPGKAAARN